MFPSWTFVSPWLFPLVGKLAEGLGIIIYIIFHHVLNFCPGSERVHITAARSGTASVFLTKLVTYFHRELARCLWSEFRVLKRRKINGACRRLLYMYCITLFPSEVTPGHICSRSADSQWDKWSSLTDRRSLANGGRGRRSEQPVSVYKVWKHPGSGVVQTWVHGFHIVRADNRKQTTVRDLDHDALQAASSA